MVGNVEICTLIAEPRYIEARDVLCALDEMETPVRGLEWAIANNPDMFELVNRTDHIHMAKTDSVERVNGMSIPIARIFYTIQADRTILLQDLHFEWDGTENSPV